MRKLLPFIGLMRHQWKLIFVGFSLSLLSALAGIGLLALAGWFISAAAVAGLGTASALAFNYFLPSGGVRFLAYLRIGGRYFERTTTHDATFKLLATLRVWLFEQLTPLSIGQLRAFHAGDLLSRLTGDIDALDHLYLRALSPWLLAVIITLLAWWGLCFFDVHIANVSLVWMLITLIIVPIVAVVLGNKTGQAELTAKHALRTHSVDWLHGMGEYQLSGASDIYTQKVEAASAELIQQQKRMAHTDAALQSLMVLLLGGAVLSALLLGIPAVQNHALKGSELALIVLMLMGTFEVLTPLTQAFQYWGKTLRAASRLDDIKQLQADVNFPDTSVAQPTTFDITFKNATIAPAPGADPILQNFNAEIPFGQTLTITGPSGVGKTTLLSALAKSIPSIRGQIFIGDMDIHDFSEMDLRRTLCLITQHDDIFYQTLRENLQLAKPDAADNELTDALHHAQLGRWFAQQPEGLDTVLGEAGHTLSGGQRRRLSIARALLTACPIVLLDEPTEGLDTITEAKVLKAIEALGQDRTVVRVTHRGFTLQNIQKTIALKDTSKDS
jgi:ATP-binding cassette subfamily C protein CydC